MSSARAPARVAIAVLAVIGLVACSDDAEETTAPSPRGSGGVAVADVLQFVAPIIGGGQLDGSSLAGRPVMLWFWAPT